MTIITSTQSPYKTPSPGSSTSQIHRNLTAFCEKISYDFHHGRKTAEVCCLQLLEAAHKTSWDVPDKLIRNLNVYLSKVLEKDGVEKFTRLIDRLFNNIEKDVVNIKTLSTGILQKEFIDHIHNSELYKVIPEITISQMESIVTLSAEFYDYRFYSNRDLNEILESTLRKYIRFNYEKIRYEFDQDKVLKQKKKLNPFCQMDNSFCDLFSTNRMIGIRYGMRLSNILNKILLTEPDGFKEKLYKTINTITNEDVYGLCKKIAEQQSETHSNTLLINIQNPLKGLLEVDKSYNVNFFNEKLQSIYDGGDTSIKSVAELNDFLSFFLSGNDSNPCVTGLLNVQAVTNIASSKLFSKEEKTHILNLLVRAEADLPTIDQLLHKTHWVEAFFRFSELPGLSRASGATIKWSIILFGTVQGVCEQIESLPYSEWSRTLGKYMDDTETSRYFQMGVGFDFLGCCQDELYLKNMLKADLNFTALNYLLDYSNFNFEFNSTDGGGSACRLSNLRRSLEHLAIDYSLQFKLIIKERVQRIVDFFKNPGEADEQNELSFSCFTLQLALGFTNDYIDEEIGKYLVDELEKILDPAERKTVIKNILSFLTEKRVKTIGSNLGDDLFYEKVKFELTCRVHPNFLNYLWKYLKELDGVMSNDIAKSIHANIDWWDIVFNEGQLRVLVEGLVAALSNDLTDEAAAIIYPYLSTLVDTYKSPQKQKSIGLLFLNTALKYANQSPEKDNLEEKVILNLFKCLKKNNWELYHKKLKIYQNENYIVEELYDRPIFKTFIQVIVDSIKSHSEKFGKSLSIAKGIVKEDLDWYDLFFHVYSTPELLNSLKELCYGKFFEVYNKSYTRKLVGFCSSLSSKEDINHAVNATIELLANQTLENKKNYINNIFYILNDKNMNAYYHYNKGGFSLFVDVVKLQNSQLGTNYFQELFIRLIKEQWFKHLYSSQLQREFAKNYQNQWITTLIPQVKEYH